LLHAASWLTDLDDIIHDLVNGRAKHTIADADRPRHSISALPQRNIMFFVGAFPSGEAMSALN
jgi:hypothetical protein